MPLIEPVARCRKFNSLNGNLGAQLFYLQLKTITDPLGRHDAHPAVLRSTLFPLNKAIQDIHIQSWLQHCEHAGLLRCYGDSKGELVVEVFDAMQRLSPQNMKSKYGDPVGQMPLLVEQSGKHPPPKRNGSEVKRRESRARSGEGEHRTSNIEHPTSNAGSVSPEGSTAEVEPSVTGPTLAMVLECAQRIGVLAESARAFHAHHEDNNCWFNQFNRLINWQSKLKTWGEQDRGKKYETNGRSHAGGNDRNAGTFNAHTNTDGLKSKIRGMA